MPVAIQPRVPSRPPLAAIVTPPAGADAANERELVERARNHSSEAFGELVRLHQRRAYAVARAILGSHEDAEDAVQEAFIHALRAIDRFVPGHAFGPWIARIAGNAALDLARRRRVRATEELPPALALPFRDPAVSDELRTALGTALETLPARQRAVVMLHDVEGYQHGEIGEMLGIPEGTSRSDLHHARAALRRSLGQLVADG